jgi:hypothetical protein
LQYAAARQRKTAEDAAFRIYIADTLYFMARNQAINVRWGAWVGHEEPPETDADPDEIKAKITNGLKGLMP